MLSELGGALMRCTSLDEGYVLVTRAAQRLFPEVAGTLFVPRPGAAALEAVLAWGASAHPFPALPEHDCRALDQRRIVLGEEPCAGCCCEVVPQARSRTILCVPLDVACRYGGEEFVLMLPTASLEVVVARAEAIRRSIRALVLAVRAGDDLALPDALA